MVIIAFKNVYVN